MKKKPAPVLVERAMAFVDDILLVRCEPGSKIFDIRDGKEVFLGIVGNRMPVINGMTCYLSEDDYDAAKDALPNRNLKTRH